MGQEAHPSPQTSGPVVSKSRSALPPLALAALLVFAGPASAEQSAASAAAKGRIAPVSLQVTDSSLSTSARKALAAKMEALIGAALATPAFTDPRGFSLTRSVRIHAPLDGMPADHPARAEAILIAQDIDLESGAKPDASGAYMGRLEGPTFRILVNDLHALYSNYSGGGDPAQEVQYLPMRIGAVGGFPVFRVGVRDVVVIAKPGREPFIRVSKSDYLQGLIDETRATMAEIGGTPHPKMQATLDSQVAALAALSPQARAQPACASPRLRQFFGDCAANDATFYVRPNLDYFDKGAPKTAVQLVMISTPAEGGQGHKRLGPKMRAAAAAMDYAAIQAALD
jgi:hypothetical protein